MRICSLFFTGFREKIKKLYKHLNKFTSEKVPKWSMNCGDLNLYKIEDRPIDLAVRSSQTSVANIDKAS